MAKRPMLDVTAYTPAAADRIHSFHPDIVGAVSAAVAKDAVVVVGMKTNPFVKKACKALTAAGINHTFLEYGGYTSKWKERLALKMWSGWPTFPQVFVKGVLVGGCDETLKALESGELKRWLEQGPPRA